MSSGFDTTTFANALKIRYSPDYVESMAYKDAPFFAMLKKNEDFGGLQWDQPILYEDVQARSASFSQAQTLSTSLAASIKKFSVTRVSDYGIATVGGELILASKNDQSTFWRSVTTQIDSIMRATTISAKISLYRKGWGAIGTVSSPTASTTLTLTNPTDVVNFAKDQVIVFSSSESAAVLRASGASLTVNGVNRSAGTLTVSANVTTITSIADGDSIFIKGDREDSATPTRRKIAGLEDWCPQTAPTSTTFFGVDRTVDTRLGGCRLDSTSPVLNLEEALIDGATLVNREGGNPDYAFMNPKKVGDLIKLLGSKVQYVDVNVGKIGFRALEVHLPTGTIKVIGDRFCPVDRAFLLQMDTWFLGSLGGLPRILDHDGRQSVRQSSDDGIEIRVGYYGNLVCKAPGWNCNIKI
jgi:hypothetical protein